MSKRVIKSKYGLFHNFMYILKSIVDYDKKIIAADIAEIISGILVPLGE